jgi:hypothetical protein
MCRLKPAAFDFTEIRAHVCEMELSASLKPVNPIAKGFIMHKDQLNFFIFSCDTCWVLWEKIK